jgi:hypothetical protein
LLVKIIVQQVLFGALFGQAWMHWLQALPYWQNNVIPLAGAALAVVLAAVAFLRGPPIIRYAMFGAGVLMTAAMTRPQIDMVQPQWPLMQLPGVGDRYYHLPMLVWLGILLTVASMANKGLRFVSIALLACFGFGLAGDFHMHERPSTGFAQAAREFEAAPPNPNIGLRLPMLPFGFMVLWKH